MSADMRLNSDTQLNFDTSHNQDATPNPDKVLLQSLTRPLRRVLPRLPHWLARMTPPRVNAVLFQNLLRHALRRQWQADTLAGLRGQWLLIDVRDLGMRFWLTATVAGVRVSDQPQPAAVSIRGDHTAFLRLMQRECDPDTLFFRRQLLIEGDTALGLEIKHFLDAIDPAQLPAPWPALHRYWLQFMPASPLQ